MAKNLGIILAKGSSTRVPKKNIRKICGKELFLYTVDILRATGVCEKIVVSTDDDDIRAVALGYGVDDVIMRDPAWDKDEWQFNAPIHGTIEKYEAQVNEQFDVCTIILGNAIFVRPSWFRTALHLLLNYRHADIKLTHIYPVDCPDSMCTVFRIHRAGLYFAHRFPLPHVGINLDIDEEEDLELAREIISRVDYPLNETTHDSPKRLKTAIKKGNVPRIPR